jgi:hypothetical protein
LYADAVFEVVPGSHFRPATADEAAALRAEGGTTRPLAGALTVGLGPGDG